MNSNNIIKAALFIACLVTTGVAQAFVGTIAVGLGRMQEVGEIQTSFAGDAVLETEDMTASSRIYYQPGMVRDEMNMGGQEMVTIRRFDLQKVWTILGQGMYMETAGDEQNERAPEYKLISREIIGPEIVNGMATIKYKSVYESPDGKFGGFTWFTDDNIAVKGFMVSESEGEKTRIKFEFTSLTRGPQDDGLFELPPGSQKFDMPSFSGMQGMGQPGSSGGYPSPPPGAEGSAPGATAPPAAPAGTESEDSKSTNDDSLADVVVDDTQNTVENTTRQETQRAVRDSVRKGFGKIFGR